MGLCGVEVVCLLAFQNPREMGAHILRGLAEQWWLRGSSFTSAVLPITTGMFTSR